MIISQFEIPFYLNEGRCCAQVALRMALEGKYQKFFPLDILVDKTMYEDPMLTFPSQIAYGLHKLNLPFQYFLKPDWRNVCENFDQETEGYKNVNVELTQRVTKIIATSRNSNIVDTKPNIHFLETAIIEGNIPLCLVNLDVYYGRNDVKTGHYLVMHGFDENHFYFKDCGPSNSSANKQISKEKFDEMFGKICPLDYGLIII